MNSNNSSRPPAMTRAWLREHLNIPDNVQFTNYSSEGLANLKQLAHLICKNMDQRFVQALPFEERLISHGIPFLMKYTAPTHSSLTQGVIIDHAFTWSNTPERHVWGDWYSRLIHTALDNTYLWINPNVVAIAKITI